MRHIPPTRQYVLELVRERGAKFVYGPDWPHSDSKTIQKLFSMTDAEYMRQCGCDQDDPRALYGRRRGPRL